MTETVKTSSLRIADFRWYLAGRFLLTFGVQMQSLVVGWQIYMLTRDPLSLGLIGLAEAIPFFAIALIAGHAADTFDRKRIMLSCVMLYIICAALLVYITGNQETIFNKYGVMPIYAVIVVTGIARGFMWPALSALGAQLIPRELYGNASTWSSLVWQTASVGGPAVGGLVCGFFGMFNTYSVVLVFTFAALIAFRRIVPKPMPEKSGVEGIRKSLGAGVKFVFNDQMILSAISLDMFAVFFGGAVCVLPMFADQILHVGADGLGILRAAPAVGAAVMSVVQMHKPPFKNAGRNLLAAVTGFGLATILFAFSRNYYLAIFALFLTGIFDNVSVVIRSTIMQLFTPDEMRGRVSAVNSVFIGSSNELGSLESGVAAKIMGLVPSIVFGGAMTIAVVTGVRVLAPRLRTLKL